MTNTILPLGTPRFKDSDLVALAGMLEGYRAVRPLDDDEIALLPDLLLGVQRVALPPIRLDRRTFDGGLEPFNC